MTVHWGALLAVLAVSVSTTVAVVVLVTVALLGLSARATRATPTAAHRAPTRHPLFSPVAGTAVAVACLAGAAVIVAFGLWAIVAR
jgi:hypothetical protein